MTTETLSRDLALRIGLAARILPDTNPQRLINVLIDCVGIPLTEPKLTALKVKDLKNAAEGELANLPQEQLKEALRYLKGEATVDSIDEALPPTQPFNEGDMPNSIRVACASNSADNIDGHFGSCTRFLIYQVSQEEYRLIDIRSTAGDIEGEEKNVFRTELIKDCHVLYVASIGGPPAAKVVKAGIHPIKMPQGGQASDIIQQLKTIIAGTPPPWLAKIMGISAEQRVRFERSEEEI